MTETLQLEAGSDPRFGPRLDRKLARTFLRRRARLSDGPTPVTFSFDDIPASAGSLGARILEESGVRGTFFVATGLLSKRFGPWEFADADMVRRLVSVGHEIGCHTHSHPDCQRLRTDALLDEIEHNRTALKDIVPGAQIGSFAYPYGSLGWRHKSVLMHEFAVSRGTHPAINGSSPDLAQLSSFTLNDAKTPTRRLRELIAETQAIGGWLVFHTHDVSDDPTSEGCSQHLLRTAVNLAQAAGCKVLPFRDVMPRIEERGRRTG